MEGGGEERERERDRGAMTRVAVACCSAAMQRGERVGGMEGWRRGVRENGEGWRVEGGGRKKANVPLQGRFDEMR